MQKSLAQMKHETEAANTVALHSLQAALVHLHEAFASVRHYTALGSLAEALKAVRCAENLLSSQLE